MWSSDRGGWRRCSTCSLTSRCGKRLRTTVQQPRDLNGGWQARLHSDTSGRAHVGAADGLRVLPAQRARGWPGHSAGRRPAAWLRPCSQYASLVTAPVMAGGWRPCMFLRAFLELRFGCNATSRAWMLAHSLQTLATDAGGFAGKCGILPTGLGVQSSRVVRAGRSRESECNVWQLCLPIAALCVPSAGVYM